MQLVSYAADALFCYDYNFPTAIYSNTVHLVTQMFAKCCDFLIKKNILKNYIQFIFESMRHLRENFITSTKSK